MHLFEIGPCLQNKRAHFSSTNPIILTAYIKVTYCLIFNHIGDIGIYSRSNRGISCAHDNTTIIRMTRLAIQSVISSKSNIVPDKKYPYCRKVNAKDIL